ncbi:thioesterase II family protein [Corallococcus terminator]
MSEGKSGVALSPWFPCPPRSDVELHLLCFPYAGGTSSIYRDWSSILPDWVQVIPMRLPGRQERAEEPPQTSMRRLVGSVAFALAPFASRPLALFGYSMGALIAYELAIHLQRRQGSPPCALLVGAHRAPHRRGLVRETHVLSDAEFVDFVAALGGIPARLRQDTDLLAAVLPSMRADAALIETYRHSQSDLLRCPVTVFSGRDDSAATPAEALAWSELAAAPIRAHVLPGGHFFIRDHQETFLRMLRAELESVRDVLRLLPEDGLRPLSPRVTPARAAWRWMRA